MTVTRTVILTSGTTWRVPNTWNNLDNSVICIGAGAGGSANGGGGGGGAYASNTNVFLTPDSTVAILVGAGGAANVSGGYTSFASNTVFAPGGRANTIAISGWGVGGIGGQATECIGNVKFSGANGGNGSTGFNGGGGGGAGGNTAPGSNGSNGIVSTATAGKGGSAGLVGTIIHFDLGSDKTFDGYRWATADDNSPRDPVSWFLQISADNSNWTTVDTQKNQNITTSRQTYVGPYSITSQTVRYVRWIITDIRTADNFLQMSEFVLRNGGSDISMVGTTATTEAPTVGGQPASNLIDGSTTTKMCTSGNFPYHTYGGSGGAGGNGNAGTRGYAGWPWPSESALYGENYAGGGGGGASYAGGEGTTYYAGGGGGNFGGGGGGGIASGGSGALAGSGANGGIIITWNYESKLPSGSQYSMSDIAVSLDITPNLQLSLNDDRVRDMFGRTTAASLISFANGAGKVANGGFIATNNSTGVSSNIPLPSGWQAGDLAVLFIVNGAGTGANANVRTAGWTYLGPNTRTITTSSYTTGAFSRILQSGDSDSGPTIDQDSGGAYMITFRNASKATAIAKNVASGSTLTFPSITKTADSKKLLSFIADRDFTQNATAPTNWTEHTRVQLTFFAVECASVNSASHTDGSSIQWTNAGGIYENQGILIEIT